MKKIVNKITGRSQARQMGVSMRLLLLGLTLVAEVASALPANDNFINSLIITGLTGTSNGDNTSATLQFPCETNQVDCNDLGLTYVTNSVWFTWTAPITGPVQFDTIGSSFDTVLSVWTSDSDLCDPSLTNLVSNDQGGGADTSLVTIQATAGQTYYISVNSWNDGTFTDAGNYGAYNLNWNQTVVPPNDNFANVIPISGFNGATNGDNTGGTLETCEPNQVVCADDGPQSVTNTVWFAWTAPVSGTVQFDTIGSAFDTVLAVWTTPSGLCDPSLVNVAADDQSGGLTDPNNPDTSLLAFQATAGTTYYISVDSWDDGSFTDQGNYGPYALNWNITSTGGSPTFPTGNFQFSSGNYLVSETDSSGPNVADGGSVNPSVRGARLTVTRPAPGYGRVLVDYTLSDPGYTNTVKTAITARAITTTLTYQYYYNGQYRTYSPSNTVVTNSLGLPPGVTIVTNFVPSASDFTTTTGTLTFDDYQLSQDIILPVTQSQLVVPGGVGRLPSVAVVTLSNPRLDPQEPSALNPPGLSSTLSSTIVNAASITTTLPTLPTGLTTLNLERSTFRVKKDVAGGNAIISVLRNGGDLTKAVSVDYTINPTPGPGLTQYAPANTFPLQAASDYAKPNSDFTPVSGTLNWAANDRNPKTITIPILNNGLVEFNQDFLVKLYFANAASHTTEVVGEVNQANVTILFDYTDGQQQPAGAVDRTWNKDNWETSNPPKLPYPGTAGGGGTVYAVAEQPDGKAIVAGSFTSYDSNPYNRIVRVLSNGFQDSAFLVAPNSGANDFISSLALQPDGKIIIGGNFTSFNGLGRYHVARLNSNGTLDTTFNPGLGANGTVWAVALQSDGKIFIGGDFTSYNRTNCNHLARLNTDGSLDTGFAPGSSINGSVYALAVPPFAPINVTNTAVGTDLENIFPVNLGSATSGTLTVNYDFLAVPDDMRVFYGDTNGVLVYDTGSISGSGQLVIPFASTNGFTTNLITIVMNQGNGTPGTFWTYDASIVTAGSTQVYAGGAFNEVNGVACGGVARFNGDGALDTTFTPGIGTYNPDSYATDPIYALGLQSDGKLIIGGAFSYLDLLDYNGLARLNTDGTLDLTFKSGTGTLNPVTGDADTIYSILLQPDGGILIGGDLTTFNQTRRIGVARLYSNGTVDTSFMDTAYNQFAGLPTQYFNQDAVGTTYPYYNTRNAVYALARESGGNVIIGGTFPWVGGGYTIDDIHPRSNVARLVGGATPGPGNLELAYDKYSVNNSDGQLYVSLVRTNGNLGIVSATFSTNAAGVGPGVASGADFGLDPIYSNPTWDTAWYNGNGAFDYSYCTYGPNYALLPAGNKSAGAVTGNPDVIVTVTNSGNISGNLTANFALSNPVGNFSLGGQFISVGAALGAQMAAPLTIIDSNIKPGVLGFSAPTYSVIQNRSTATITVTRTNGSDGVVSIWYATSNGTATNGLDYTGKTNLLTFPVGSTNQTFTVVTKSVTSIQPDKTVNLMLFSPSGGATLGQTNAVLNLINGNYVNGHVSLSATNYTVGENAGSAVITVNRLGGSTGTLKVTLLTADGTAFAGTNYTGISTNLQWNNTDATPRNIVIPVRDDGVVTSNVFAYLRLTNSIVNNINTSVPLSFGGTNATLTINNIDSAGSVQFSSPTYSVKKYGGYALIPVTRTGGSIGTVTFGYKTINGTALAGSSYSTTAGTLTFTNGQVSASFNVPITNNPGITGLVSLSLQLTNQSGLGSLGNPNLATLNIIDSGSVNETPGSPDVTYGSPVNGFNAAVYALALQPNNQLIVGGDFTQANGVYRQRIARLNDDGSVDPTFSLPSSTMGADNSVRAIAIQTDGRILCGGYFTNMNSITVSGIARLNYDGSLDSLFNAGSGADNPIYALGETFVDGNRKILVSGSFANLNGVPANGIARLNDDGSPDTSFNVGGSGANATVYALAVQTDGKVIIGGDFTAVNGITVGHIARLNVDGSVDLTFTNAAASDSVHALAIQLDGQILAGGLFTSVNGNSSYHRIVRLNSTDGLPDSSFNPSPGANNSVFSIAVQTDSRIVVGGTFTLASGVTRNRITRLNADGSVDATINFGMGADSFVSAIAIEESTIAGYPTNVPDEKIIIGGGFTHYFGEPHPNIARIYGGSIGGSGAFEFSKADYGVNENGTNIIITINRTGGTSGTNVDGSGDVLVAFATTNGTALAGVNYTGVLTNLGFPEGEVQTTVTIPVMDDHVITNDLTVDLSLTPIAPAAYGNQPTAVLTISNVDSAISFTVANYQVNKYGSNVLNGVAPITIRRLGATYGTSTAVFNTSPGTATPGVDYLPATNVLVTFAPGVTVQSVNIPIINGVPDGNTTVNLQLANVTGSALANPSNAVLTILDRTLSAGAFAFSAPNYVVSEGGGVGYTNVLITVLRTNGASGIVSVGYSTSDGTANAGVKYVATAGVLTYGDGEMSKSFVVPVVNTATIEPTENFNLSLFNPTGGAGLDVQTNASVTILNTNIGIVFASATNTVLETQPYAIINVVRYNNTQGTATVTYATTNGTALAGVDYTASSGTLTFNDGVSQAAILVPLLRNTNATGDLQFTVGLANPSSAVQIGTPGVTTVILQDADTRLSFTTNSSTVFKNAGNAVIAVICSNTNAESVSVSYATTNGTAVAGIDYTATTGTLTFSNGVSIQTFSVPISNNSLINGNHTFDVSLSNPTGNGRLGSPTQQTVTILDSNSGLNLSSASYTVSKTSGMAVITVYRMDNTNVVSSVDFVATNGTAVNGLNYYATNGTLVFTNGDTVKTFGVPIIATTTVQPDLTVLVSLSNPVNGILINPSAATLTIRDNSGSFVIPAGSQLLLETNAGVPNGIIDPNESVEMLFAFRDVAGLDVTNLVATLLATNGVNNPSPSAQTYGHLTAYGHSVSKPFAFAVAGTNNQQIAATFALRDGANSIGTAVFGYNLGKASQVFSNTAAIVINDNSAASPYPSIINVTGVGGQLIKATVTLNKLTHSNPHDVSALVASPNGTNTLLMSHVGGDGYSATNLVLTFDDAAGSLPFTGAITNGTYKPTSTNQPNTFP